MFFVFFCFFFVEKWEKYLSVYSDTGVFCPNIGLNKRICLFEKSLDNNKQHNI